MIIEIDYFWIQNKKSIKNTVYGLFKALR